MDIRVVIKYFYARFKFLSHDFISLNLQAFEIIAAPDRLHDTGTRIR